MRKNVLIVLILLSVMCIFTLAGCAGESESNRPPAEPPGDNVERNLKLQGPDTQGEEQEPDNSILWLETPSGSVETEPSAKFDMPTESKTSSEPPASKAPAQPEEADIIPAVNLQVGSKTFTVTLYDNDTTRAFLEKLPLTLDMEELNGNEKFYFFAEKLPTNSERVGSIKVGDLMLYGSDCLVLFYESFSTSYSYTRLGYVEDVAGLADALGSGSVKVSFQK